jgi:lipopolysaccharide transport system permease protein
MTLKHNQYLANNNLYPAVTVYTPESSLRNPILMLYNMFRDLHSGRELAWRLAIRDIQAQYRQAALGLLWAFISPLANSVVWIFLFFSGIVPLHSTTLSYPIYVLSGTILWSIFMDSVNAPLGQINSAKSMLSKINFPREALIISGIYQTVFNGVIKICILLIMLLVLYIYPGWPTLGIHTGWSLTFFPFGIFSLIFTGTAIGLFVTPIGMLYTDIGRVLQLIMQFLMYLTPVVFTLESIESSPLSWVAILYKINPLTPLLLTSRDWLMGSSPAYLGYFLLINGLTILVLMIAWAIYKVAMPIIIERMNA